MKQDLISTYSKVYGTYVKHLDVERILTVREIFNLSVADPYIFLVVIF